MTTPCTYPLPRFNEWSTKYDGLYSIKLASGTAIVITDRCLVRELMDKKSSTSSNRPLTYFIDNVLQQDDYLLTMSHTDPQWRAARKFIHQYFMESMVEEQHISVIDAEAVQMLRDFCVAPEEVLDSPKRFANSLIMSTGELDSALFMIVTPH